MTIPRNLSFLAQGASSTGVLSVLYGGTGQTSFITGYIPYGNGTGALSTSSNLFFNGSSLGIGTTSPVSGGFGSGVTVNVPTGQGARLDMQVNAASILALTSDASWITFDGNSPYRWYYNGVLAMTLDTSRNLSVTGTVNTGSNINVNTTLSAWGLGNVLQLAGGSIWAANTSNIGTVQNIYYDGSVFKYINTIGASYLQQSAGNYYFQTAPSGTAGNTATLTTVMQIANSGGVSIGNTTDPGASNLSVTGTIASASTIKTAGYTVATLPTGLTGARAYVTNALAPTYGATVVGGGAVTIPVFYNGANWICA